MDRINEMGPERVLIFSRDNWPYLTDKWKCGGYSPWLQNEIGDFAVDMLIKYYEMDLARKPDVIYIDVQYGEYGDKLLERAGYKIIEAAPSGNSIAVLK